TRRGLCRSSGIGGDNSGGDKGRIVRRLRVAVLDLVTKGPTRRLFNRIMNANLASIMPQAIAVWCEELGHDVRFVCYTDREDLYRELPDDLDVLFIGAFTHA